MFALYLQHDRCTCNKTSRRVRVIFLRYSKSLSKWARLWVFNFAGIKENVLRSSFKGPDIFDRF